MAGHIAAAEIQLRRDPAGRRQPVRVRSAGRTARGAERRPHRGRGASALMHLLVVANETVTGRKLIEAVERHRGEDLRVTVICPVNQPERGYVVYEDTRRAAAGRRLDRTLAMLRDEGIPAHGLVVESDPVTAVRDALAQLEPPVDALIVATHPQQKSGWLRKNVIDRIRDAAGGRPVEHVVVDVAAESGQQNVLVIANETVLGATLLDKVRERARRGDAR